MPLIQLNSIYQDALKEELQMEKWLMRYLGIQLSNLEILDRQIEIEKSVKDDLIQKCKCMNNLVQQKQEQIEYIQLTIEHVVASKQEDNDKSLQMIQHLQQENEILQKRKDELINKISVLNADMRKCNQVELMNKIQERQRNKILKLNEELLSVDFLTKRHFLSFILFYKKLKGKIRVICRIRPHLNYADKIAQVLDDYRLILSDPSKSIQSPENKSKNCFTEHTFMKVYENSTQLEIFNDLNFFLNSFLTGSNVCIFTYGPTGSGKTFTMFGDMSDQNLKGIIPRSMEQLCFRLEEYEKNGWQRDVGISIIELYNEKIKDLIKNENLSDRKEPYQSNLPQNLTYHQKLQFLLSQISTATKNRIVRKTKCNQHSSRSHLILKIKLKITNEELNSCLEGSLHLVDLAGCERMQLCQTTGDGQKETIFINQSLQVLSAVIKGIKNNDAHIPYRNSLLTQYLRNYLNSKSKTMVILNISSQKKFYAQTRDALNLLSLKQIQHRTRSLQQSPVQQESNKTDKNPIISTDQKSQAQKKRQITLENKLNSYSSTQKTMLL